MFAFRRAYLSVAPERLEQFTIEMKKNINEKHNRNRRSNKESSKNKSSTSSRSKSSKQQKCSGRNSHSKKENDRKISERKKSRSRKKSPSSRSRNKERKHRWKSPSDRKDGDEQKNSKYDSDFDPKDFEGLTVPLLSLSDMIKDRKVMLETAFSIIKGPKLTLMLPDILKFTPIEEIKQLCEEQLSVMSSKRILHTLSGKEMQSSSGSDSSDEERTDSKDISVDLQLVLNQDDNLQANLADSTTHDHHSGHSMLFPSAVSAVCASAMETSDFAVSARKIKNDNKDEDDVSTSTEPNFIYTEEVDEAMVVTHPSPDTEEGEEVNISDDESDYEEDQGGSGPSPNVEAPTDIAGDQDVLDLDVQYPIDEVLMEVEEIEEHEEEQVKVVGFEQEENMVENSFTKVEVTEMTDELQTTSEGVTIAKTKNTVPGPTTSLAPNDPPGGRSGKTLLEILELKSRARAIKSLMRAATAGMLKSSK